MSVEKRITAFLALAEQDLDAAELLVAGGNRYAAYHLQQTTEKLVKALLIARGIEAGLEHRVEELLKRLPPEDPWRANLTPFAPYSAFATAFRYPTPGGRIVPGPEPEILRRDVRGLRTLIHAARTELLRPSP